MVNSTDITPAEVLAKRAADARAEAATISDDIERHMTEVDSLKQYRRDLIDHAIRMDQAATTLNAKP